MREGWLPQRFPFSVARKIGWRHAPKYFITVYLKCWNLAKTRGGSISLHPSLPSFLSTVEMGVSSSACPMLQTENTIYYKYDTVYDILWKRDSAFANLTYAGLIIYVEFISLLAAADITTIYVAAILIAIVRVLSTFVNVWKNNKELITKLTKA